MHFIYAVQAFVQFTPGEGVGPRALIAALESAGFAAGLWKGDVHGRR